MKHYEMQYQNDLQYQKDKLKRNLEHLRERSRENDLLSSVIIDYERYEERLRMKDRQLSEQQTAHEKHLQMLDAYVQDIMETNELTESGLNKLTYENNRILEEIDRLRTRALDTIPDNELQDEPDKTVEPVNTEAESDQTEAESDAVEPVKTDQTEVEPVKTDQTEVEPVKTVEPEKELNPR
jgi:hypothetical protein